MSTRAKGTVVRRTGGQVLVDLGGGRLALCYPPFLQEGREVEVEVNEGSSSGWRGAEAGVIVAVCPPPKETA